MDSPQSIPHADRRRARGPRHPSAPFVAQVAGLSLPEDRAARAYTPAPEAAPPLGIVLRESA